MDDQSQRLNSPISTAELERRWTAVRVAMDEHHIDVLLMQNNNDFMGGYVKYFTDLPAANGYPITVVFPRNDGMTVIGQGPFGQDRELPPPGDGLHRGVKRIMGTPSYASAPYTRTYDAELAEKALESFSSGTIGLVGSASMPYAFVDYVRRGKPSNATFVEASDIVDWIKAVKSNEEISLVRKTAAMQDAAMEAAFSAIEPGKRDIEVSAVAEMVGHRLGSEQGLFLCGSDPAGASIHPGPRHNQNRVIGKGDQFSLLIENNGAGGFYAEMARTCVLGKIPQKMKDEFAVILEARNFTLKQLTSGASCKDIWDSYNKFLRDHGKPEEARLYCHGQGYDLVERPLVRHDEPMPIKKNMVLAIHPGWMSDGAWHWICDDYLVGERGVERLHKAPEKIYQRD